MKEVTQWGKFHIPHSVQQQFNYYHSNQQMHANETDGSLREGEFQNATVRYVFILFFRTDDVLVIISSEYKLY